MSAARRLRWRKVVNLVMLTGTGVCAALIAGVLLFILGYLLVNGASSLNLAFFTELPKPVGESSATPNSRSTRPSPKPPSAPPARK